MVRKMSLLQISITARPKTAVMTKTVNRVRQSEVFFGPARLVINVACTRLISAHGTPLRPASHHEPEPTAESYGHISLSVEDTAKPLKESGLQCALTPLPLSSRTSET
jgi:hypothetical protein